MRPEVDLEATLKGIDSLVLEEVENRPAYLDKEQIPMTTGKGIIEVKRKGIGAGETLTMADLLKVEMTILIPKLAIGLLVKEKSTYNLKKTEAAVKNLIKSLNVPADGMRKVTMTENLVEFPKKQIIQLKKVWITTENGTIIINMMAVKIGVITRNWTILGDLTEE